MKAIKIILSLLLIAGCTQSINSENIGRDSASKSSASETQTGKVSAAGGSDAVVAATSAKTTPASGCSGLGCVFGYVWGLFEDTEKSHTTIEVFYATDRERSTLDGEYTSDWAEEISYGKASISIPGAHEIGDIEKPGWFFGEDPDKHMLVRSTTLLPQKKYFSELERRLNKPGSLLVFVHGYNVSFEDAALRTGQMAADLRFKGVPIFYSWPSKGDLKGYQVDSNTMEWSKKNIEYFLTQLLNDTTASNIYLLGHSMGTRGLTQAYIEVAEQLPEAKKRIKEVILAAPDIDTKIFKRDIAPKLLEAGAPVTVYVSSRDTALKASRNINGSLARVGAGGMNVTVIDGIETIDVSALGTGFLNHSTFADVRPAINDMSSIIHYGKRADERFGLESVKTDSGIYWKMRK